jgi:hypothetical protein
VTVVELDGAIGATQSDRQLVRHTTTRRGMSELCDGGRQADPLSRARPEPSARGERNPGRAVPYMKVLPAFGIAGCQRDRLKRAAVLAACVLSPFRALLNTGDRRRPNCKASDLQIPLLNRNSRRRR